jgi:hypothetical protein
MYFCVGREARTLVYTIRSFVTIVLTATSGAFIVTEPRMPLYARMIFKGIVMAAECSIHGESRWDGVTWNRGFIYHEAKLRKRRSAAAMMSVSLTKEWRDPSPQNTRVILLHNAYGWSSIKILKQLQVRRRSDSWLFDRSCRYKWCTQVWSRVVWDDPAMSHKVNLVDGSTVSVIAFIARALPYAE